MHSNYQSFTPSSRSARAAHHHFGLTAPAVIEAYVNRRVEDPALLSVPGGPKYADFFAANGE